MLDNPAARKKMRRLEGNKESVYHLKTLLKYAILRSLATYSYGSSLQTTQARLEVSRIKYNIKNPKKALAVVYGLDVPVVNGIYGTLYIHRQKVKDKEAAHVAIPIGGELKRIIEEQRITLQAPMLFIGYQFKTANPISSEVQHPTQVVPSYLSRAFSKARDKAGAYADLPQEQRPTFHEIRALAAHLFEKSGVDPL